jgi:hypothetical protein
MNVFNVKIMSGLLDDHLRPLNGPLHAFARRGLIFSTTTNHLGKVIRTTAATTFPSKRVSDSGVGTGCGAVTQLTSPNKQAEAVSTGWFSLPPVFVTKCADT